MILYKKIIIRFILSIIFLLSILIFLIINPSSLKFILKKTISIIPELKIEQLNGNWQNLSFKGIHYKKNGINLTIENFNLAIKPSDLLYFNICFKQILLKNVNIKIDTKKILISNNKSKFKNIIFYLPINFLKINIDNINLLVDNIKISLLHLNSGFLLKKNNLKLKSTKFINLSIFIPNIKNIQKSFSFLKKNKDFHKISISQLINKNYFSYIPINIDLDNISIKKLIINYININHVLIKANIHNNLLNLNNLDVYGNFGIINMKGKINFIKKYPIHIFIYNWLNFSKIKNQKIFIELKGNILNSIKLIMNVENIINFKTYIILNNKNHNFSSLFNIYNSQIYFPRNNNYYELIDTNFIVSGTLNNYLISLSTKLYSNKISPIKIFFKGKGNLKKFKIDKMIINTNKGIIDLTALVEWKNHIKFYSKFLISNFSSFKKYQDYPINLKGEVMITDFYFYKKKWKINFFKINLKGMFRNKIINLLGKIILDKNNISYISNFKLFFEKNFININGFFGKKINLNININVQNINSLLPNYKGKIHGNIKLLGSFVKPKILIKLNIKNFLCKKFSIDLLNINSFINNKSKNINNINLHIKNLKQKFLCINQLILNITNNFIKNRIIFVMKILSKTIDTNLILKGSFNKHKKNWQVKIQKININSLLGKWKLNKKINISHLKDKNIITISSHCWKYNNSKICFINPITLGSLNNFNIVFNNFDLTKFKSFCKNNNLRKNIFNGKIYFCWDILNEFISFSLKGKKTKQNENNLFISNDNINLKFILLKNKIYFNWLIDIKNQIQSNGEIFINDFKNQKKINGNINIHNISLEIINFLFLKDDKINGKISGNLVFRGSLHSPKILGNLVLENINTSIFPLNITSSKLNIILKGKYANIYGLAKTIKGNINLHGDLKWKDIKQWSLYIYSNINLDKVILSPMINISMISNFIFQASPNNYYLYGKLKIPWARIILQNIPNDIIESSSDEIIINDNKNLTNVIPNLSNFFIKTNLLFDFSKDVQLSAFGFNVKLNGQLNLLNNKNAKTLNGNINILSGKFNAYGQELIVRKGNIHFIGSLDTPYINLEAIRNIELTEDSVVAGLRINGFINNPKIDIFTEPKMSKQLAISYLLHGNSTLDNSNDSNVLTSAILGLGIFHGEKIISKIGKKFGMHNLVLDAINIGGNQQIQISSYILPNLQIKYGFNMFNSFTMFTVRYRLFPKLYLEISSGLNKTLDILYHFEF